MYLRKFHSLVFGNSSSRKEFYFLCAELFVYLNVELFNIKYWNSHILLDSFLPNESWIWYYKIAQLLASEIVDASTWESLMPVSLKNMVIGNECSCSDCKLSMEILMILTRIKKKCIWRLKWLCAHLHKLEQLKQIYQF